MNLTLAELKRLMIANPDLAAANVESIRSLSVSAPSGATEAQKAAQDTTDGADTLLAYLKTLAPDLPVPIRDLPFETFRIDLAWPDRKLAIEVNGGRWLPGGGKHGTERDRHKIRRLVLAGWRVLEYSTEMVDNNPIGVIEEIREAIDARP